MQQINIQIEDWQQEALNQMAADRGVPTELLARTLLSERIVERIHCAFDDLVMPSRRVETDVQPAESHIEQRLRRVFDTW